MTESEAKTKPLYELWKEFQDLQRVVSLSMSTDEGRYRAKNEPFRSHYQRELGEIETLRKELLDRCNGGISTPTDAYSLFSIKDGQAYSVSYPRLRADSAKTAKEMSAAYAFIAWELEQIAKENEAK